MKWQFLLIFSISLLISLSLISADIISINAGGDNNIIINSHENIEGFFSWSDIDISSASWTISEGGNILSLRFINYTLTKSRNWLINEQGKIIIKCYEKEGNLIDVHNINVNFDDEYIKSANLTRLDVGEYHIIFDINNKIGETNFLFNIDGNEQSISVNIKERKEVRLSIVDFFRNNLWFLILIIMIFLIIIIIFIIVAIRDKENKKAYK